jgi:hypothetical protein
MMLAHHMPSLTESAGKHIQRSYPPCKLRHVADAKTFFKIPPELGRCRVEPPPNFSNNRAKGISLINALKDAVGKK